MNVREREAGGGGVVGRGGIREAVVGTRRWSRLRTGPERTHMR